MLFYQFVFKNQKKKLKMSSDYSKILEKFSDLLSNDDKKDTTFIFGNSKDEVKAHKALLVSVSSVFEQMFDGDCHNDDEVIITGIKPDVFQKLINVIYMKPVEYTDVYEAVEVYKVAEMYNSVYVKSVIVKYLEEKCTLENCIFLYDKALLFNMATIIDKCRSFIKRFPNAIPIATLGIREEILEDTFVDFITRSRLPSTDLYQLMEYLVEIGKLRTFKKALCKINFLTISISIIVTAKLLSNTEKLAIISNIDAIKGKHAPSIPMPDNFSSDKYEGLYYKIDTTYFWIAILLLSPADYFEIPYKRVLTLGKEFSSAHIENIKEAFKCVIDGKTINKKGFDIASSILTQNNWYKISYSEDEIMEVWYNSSQYRVFSYSFKTT